jgi:hypothetical protein
VAREERNRTTVRPPSPAAPWREVPGEAAAVIRPQLDGMVEEIILVLRAEVPEYDQPLEGEFGRLIREGVTVALHLFVDLLGQDADLPDARVYEAIGRAEFRAGRTLDALQAAYRVGARVAWRAVVVAGEGTLEPRVLFGLAEAIFAYIDRLADASVAGYAQEQSVREGSAQARRQALAELLLAGPLTDPEAVQLAADQAGWPLPARLAVLAIGDAEPAVVARRMPPGTIGASLGSAGVLLVPDPDAPGRGAQIATALRRRRGVLGPTVAWPHAHRSARRALMGWPLHAAGRLGGSLLARADEHLLDLALAGDERLTRELAERRLAPLASMTPVAKRDAARETLRAWLDAHGDVSATAQALHVHPQTVRYRLAGLRQAFGTALDEPAARLEVAVALRAEGLLPPPDG